jgi:hypothetical protein
LHLRESVEGCSDPSLTAEFLVIFEFESIAGSIGIST